MIHVDPHMFELFREEVRAHAATLARGLLDVEADPSNPTRIEPLMRAAHSIKGACRIVGIESGVRLAHVMEDALVAAQRGAVRLDPDAIDRLLQGADVLAGLADLTPDTAAGWERERAATIESLVPAFADIAAGRGTPPRAPTARSARPAAAVAGEFPEVPAFVPAELPDEPLPLPPDHSMHDRFREELRSHLRAVAAENVEAAIEGLRQVRGAARIVRCEAIAGVASALADYLAAVREQRRTPTEAGKNWLQFAISILAEAVATDDETFPGWLAAKSPMLEEIAGLFRQQSRASPDSSQAKRIAPAVAEDPPTPAAETVSSVAGSETAVPPQSVAVQAAPPAEAVVRVTAQSLNRLMGLAGESLVQARWLPSYSTALMALKKHHDVLSTTLERAHQAAAGGGTTEQLAAFLADARVQAGVCRTALTDKTADFDEHAARAEDLNSRLYREVIASRMRPFGDGVHGLPRLVRDMARALDKDARLEIVGEQTEVDRDILEKLESPLSHLIRNAVDHGIEPRELRAARGKAAVGTIRLEARHRAGMLQVTIADDGGGADLEKLRKKIVERGLSPAEIVRKLTDAELLEFLFLPGFSTSTRVTEYSGRGVGLDVVQDTVRKIGGSARITSEPGRGTAFHLQLPLTLSVIRAVVVNVSGEPYAFPHTRIDRLIHVERSAIRSIERRQFVEVDGQNVGLVLAGQLLDLPGLPAPGADLSVVLLSDVGGSYGLVVDAILGEQDLVVRPLDPRLGKVPNLSAAAILDDGSPVLIVDAEDLIRSMDQFIQTGSLARAETRSSGPARKKRILVVDDSITVREVERQLLLHRGYDVSAAVDGMDGWNAIRTESFDLLVSDVDMPRMTGIQLVKAVRADARLRDLPVVIVSYKEREEDRLLGLEVGANAYLTKSSFHDNRFLQTVEDLIGPP